MMVTGFWYNIDQDDIKMRFFILSLSGEAKKWFRHLHVGSIATFEDFQTSFLERWDDNKSLGAGAFSIS